MLTAVFDKSFLQALNMDEAVMFDMIFMSNITPLLFIETLADLKKEMRDGRTAEQVVGNLADKTPEYKAYTNASHLTLCEGELRGFDVPMDGRTHIPYGKPFRNGNKRGVSFGIAPEMHAFQRWQNHEFLEIEHSIAADWRVMLKDLPSGAMKLASRAGEKLKLKDLASARVSAEQMMRDAQPTLLLRSAMELVGLGPTRQALVAQRWNQQGRPPLERFAPYCWHVLMVQFAFELAASAGKVAADRPTNRIDLAYFNYTPFCDVFISGDRLHRQLAPIFLRDSQRFVWAHDLKADLARIAEHYAGHPDLETQGIVRVFRHSDLEIGSLCAQLLDDLRPGWRDRQARPPVQKGLAANQRLLRKLRTMTAAAERSPPDRSVASEADLDTVMFKRMISVQRGRWQILPQGVGED